MLFVKVPTNNFHGFGYNFSNNINILKLSYENFAIRYLVEALLVISVNFSYYWLVNGQEKVNRKGLVIMRCLISNKSSHLMYIVLELNTFLEDLLRLFVRKFSLHLKEA